jgi:hypothetical protein
MVAGIDTVHLESITVLAFGRLTPQKLNGNNRADYGCSMVQRRFIYLRLDVPADEPECPKPAARQRGIRPVEARVSRIASLAMDLVTIWLY